MRAEFEEIKVSLGILGLEPGAGATEIRSAFRRLVRESHPDAAMGRDEARFQEILRAYSLLRKLSPEDLQVLEEGPGEGAAGRGAPEKAPEVEPDTPLARQRDRRLSRILEQCERSVTRRLDQLDRDEDRSLLDGLLLRLRSTVPEVRRLALGRVGVLANRGEVRQALTTLLNQWDVDEETARLVAALPFKATVRRRLAQDMVHRASVLPDPLIVSLLDLQRSKTLDPSSLERYLSAARPSSVPVLLRHWPRGRPIPDATLRRLLDEEDPRVLVPVLSLMKQDFPQAAARHRGRLTELQEHPASPVRVWSRALLPKAAEGQN